MTDPTTLLNSSPATLPADAPPATSPSAVPDMPIPTTLTTRATPVPTDWRATIPMEFQREKTLERFKGKDVQEVLPVLLKAIVEGDRYIGTSVKLPTENSTPEEIKAFWTKAGKIPEKAEDYKLQAPVFPHGLEMTHEEVQKFSAYAHSKAIPPKMAQEVLDFYGEVMKTSLPNYEAEAAQALETLRDTQWGPATERNLGIAKRALYTLFGKDTAAKVEVSGLGSDPSFIKGMFDLGKMYIEDGLLPPDLATGMDESGAKTALEKILNDKTHAYWNAKDPGHEEAVQQVTQLIVYSTPT